VLHRAAVAEEPQRGSSIVVLVRRQAKEEKLKSLWRKTHVVESSRPAVESNRRRETKAETLLSPRGFFFGTVPSGKKVMDRDAIEYTRQHYDAHANKMSMAEVQGDQGREKRERAGESPLRSTNGLDDVRPHPPPLASPSRPHPTNAPHRGTNRPCAPARREPPSPSSSTTTASSESS